MLFQTDKEKIIQEHKNQNKTNLVQENQTNLKKNKKLHHRQLHPAIPWNVKALQFHHKILSSTISLYQHPHSPKHQYLISNLFNYKYISYLQFPRNDN